MFTILDYSSALEYSIIRRYTNIVYYYYLRKCTIGWIISSLTFPIKVYNVARRSLVPYRCLEKSAGSIFGQIKICASELNSVHFIQCALPITITQLSLF